MLATLKIPEPVLPQPVPGYLLPTTRQNILPWAFVVEQMSASMFYWISTINRKMQPHTVPVWGIWYENRVHLEGSPKTTWAGNAIRNPDVSIHLPSAEQVVLIEGRAQFLKDDDIDEATWKTIDTLYQTKYQVQKGSPWIVVHPRKVLAWDNPNLKTMTCWNF
jgi:hypothetical protein